MCVGRRRDRQTGRADDKQPKDSVHVGGSVGIERGRGVDEWVWWGGWEWCGWLWCVCVWGGGNECVVVMAIVRLWVGASVEVVNGVGAVGVGLRVPRALNHPLPTHQHTDVRSSCPAAHAATSYQHINSPEP